MSKQRNRRIVSSLTEREKEQSHRAINKVRKALRQHNLVMEIRTCDDPPPTPEQEEERNRRIVAEHLEAAAADIAAAVLEKNAQELRAAGQGGAAGTNVAQAKEALWEKKKKLIAKGWEITVGAALDRATKSK
jgi:hypothetical protein